MILEEFIEIKVHTKNKSKYKDNKIGDTIKIKVEDLTEGSSIKINVVCDNCLTQKQITYYAYKKATKDRDYYCNKCSYLHTQKTLIDKYGVSNAMDIDSVKNKHLNSIQSTDKKKSNQKRENTNLEKYGVKYTQQNKEIQEKTKNTTLEKYGVEYIIHTEENKTKTLKSIKNIHFAKKRQLTHHKNIVSRLSKKYNINILDYDGKYFKVKCDKNHEYFIDDTLLTNRNIKFNVDNCTVCNPIKKNSSYLENTVKKYIQELNIDFIENDKVLLNNQELDIYLPDYGVAIEFNGLYWHSELFKDKKYHYNKTIECRANKVGLIHIFEDDWIYKQDIVKSIIRNRLGLSDRIYARKCIIKEVSSDITRKFLDENHIQGFSKSQYKIGLYYGNELVSLMTFGYRKTNAKKEFELIRFCNKLNTNVIGASSKLLKYFINNYKIEDNYILSYADMSMFDGGMYEKLGFKEIHITEPNYYWVVNGVRHHRWKYNKQKLIKEGFDNSKTEVEIMKDRGYYRIYGCGQKRFEYYVSKSDNN